METRVMAPPLDSGAIEPLDRIRDLEKQISYWREFAAYLASCHAASAEGLSARTSKTERRRHASICATAALGLSGRWFPKYTYHDQDNVQAAIERCTKAAEDVKA